MKKAFRPAFTATIPVLCGYLFIGFAFGVMLRDIGFGSIWSFFCSLSIYAGSGQYLLVSLLAARASLVTVAVMTLLLNCRHIFYGLSFLETFHKMGARKWYMIFSLTDETYSLLCSLKTPSDVDPDAMRFLVAILDHAYWIIGSIIGAFIGGVLPFQQKIIDGFCRQVRAGILQAAAPAVLCSIIRQGAGGDLQFPDDFLCGNVAGKAP